MSVRGLRGATVISCNQSEAILVGTRELLTAIFAANPDLRTEDIGSAIFTVTDDLNADYPAKAARQMGWTQVPMICAREIPVPGGLVGCLRVLILWNTERYQSEVNHVYLGKAARLRPDISGQE
jgi:chorismate mutase